MGLAKGVAAKLLGRDSEAGLGARGGTVAARVAKSCSGQGGSTVVADCFEESGSYGVRQGLESGPPCGEVQV